MHVLESGNSALSDWGLTRDELEVVASMGTEWMQLTDGSPHPGSDDELGSSSDAELPEIDISIVASTESDEAWSD